MLHKWSEWRVCDLNGGFVVWMAGLLYRYLVVWLAGLWSEWRVCGLNDGFVISLSGGLNGGFVAWMAGLWSEWRVCGLNDGSVVWMTGLWSEWRVYYIVVWWWSTYSCFGIDMLVGGLMCNVSLRHSYGNIGDIQRPGVLGLSVPGQNIPCM